ncbi:hypothetical protein [Chryseobacterium indologenes]|uniref:hypothetical protein n=1 Tax=Chryseobacterium indologenes TaxID=253 RepID=UPI00076E3D0F|nr:hypothetical protein [Chryseobacterium indologenes]
MEIQNQIIKFLESKYDKGATTETLAEEFKMTNRQIGSIMGNLKRKGLIHSYTKGVIVFTDFMTRKASPARLSNSYYELIKQL